MLNPLSRFAFLSTILVLALGIFGVTTTFAASKIVAIHTGWMEETTANAGVCAPGDTLISQIRFDFVLWDSDRYSLVTRSKGVVVDDSGKTLGHLSLRDGERAGNGGELPFQETTNVMVTCKGEGKIVSLKLHVHIDANGNVHTQIKLK